jgi:hypothetical protein
MDTDDTWMPAELSSAALLDGTYITKLEDGTSQICGVIARNADGTFDGYINYDEFNQKNPVAKNLQQWRSVNITDVI